MGLSRVLLRGASASARNSRTLLQQQSLQQQHPAAAAARSSLLALRTSGPAAAEEDDGTTRRQRSPLRAQSLQQQRRAFHATNRTENPILIGLVIVVGATIARYVIRAARRVSKEEGKGGSGGSSGGSKHDEDDHEEGAAAGHGGGAHPARGFPVLGLDVGTLQSCVAFAAGKTGAPLVVENHEGRRSTPAFVSFEEGSMVVGQLARRGRWREPGRVGFNLPRLLGAGKYDDSLRPLFPFPVEPPVAGNEEGGLVLGLSGGGGRSVPSGEATARVVEDLVQTAEHKAHQLPRFAVLAVPSYYDAGAKARALRAAREGTGLEDVEVVEDAIATLACAHYTGRVSKEEAFLAKPWLVCDVGGVNAQVSVVQLDMEHGLVVKGQGTSWALGGDQLDAALVAVLVADFKKKHGGLDLGRDYLALERLYEAAEAAKVELSSKVSSNVRLPFITADHTGPKHLDATLSRAQLENLAAPLLEQLKAPFQQALEAANLKPEGLQGLIVSGGTARLPFVAGFVKQLAKPAEVPMVVLETPEEAAALGSAYFGRELVDD